MYERRALVPGIGKKKMSSKCPCLSCGNAIVAHIPSVEHGAAHWDFSSEFIAGGILSST